MANLLNLREKVKPQVKIIYKTVTQKRPWHVEIGEILAVIVVVGVVVWGTTRADETHKAETVPIEAFSISGYISNITDSSFSVNSTDYEDRTGKTSYSFNKNTVQKRETDEYVPLQFSDIQVGDKIIVQGTLDDDTFTALRVIDFSIASSTIVASSTEELASTTPATPDVSTTTEDVASSTATTTATTTPSFVDNMINTIEDTIQTVIDFVTGSSTPEATTTDEVATTTEDVIAPTSTPEIIQPADISDADNATTTE